MAKILFSVIPDLQCSANVGTKNKEIMDVPFKPQLFYESGLQVVINIIMSVSACQFCCDSYFMQLLLPIDLSCFLHCIKMVFSVCLISSMQSNGLEHLSKVYSVIAGACIPIFHCILNNST